MTKNPKSKQKVLLVNTQFVERFISGFTNRFVGLWCHIEKNPGAYTNEPEIHWVTNSTLWNKFFPGRKPPKNVSIISADLRYFRYTSRLFYPFYILYLYYRHRCTSVHVATSIVKSVYLLRLFRLFKVPHCITFASASINMAAYNSDRMKKHWEEVFRLAQNVDVLNPTNNIQTQGTKHISPASFPYMLEFHDVPAEKFINPVRRNVVLFCGSFVAQKNPILAVEGFESFLEEHDRSFPGYELWLVGKGELMPAVLQHMEMTNKKYGRETIRLIPDSQLIESLSVAKVFLSLQDYDNYPSQAVMESMLFCNSVLSLDNGDTRRMIKEELGNVLVPGKDSREVGAGIHKLIQDWQPNKANRDLILTEFSAKRFANYFFDIHRSIST